MTRNTLFLTATFFFSLAASAQVGVPYDLDKPAKFENRTLASEKSNDGKKFKKSRRFIQNTITHYNFYFNANVKLNEVIARARAQHRDDYTQLLSFYNYSLDATQAQKKELDSVIYKCTAGILIHDTRNDWIDNLYLLIGEAYYFRKTFDSAFITFQFLNFAFAPKESDGYDKPIGSNANVDEGGNANIVSTVEKRNIAQKMLSLPPSRNDALVWQVRNYISREKYAEAAALIAVLKKDPQFPPRLYTVLEEMQALWYYQQSMYDSAAVHLQKALPDAQDNEERARWEYLIAQMYERTGDAYESNLFYERTIKDTYNPVLDVYARLNAIRQHKDSAADYIQKNIDALVKMAKKDRYESYRDIIYYTAAQIELERNNKPGAEAFLIKCVRSVTSAFSPQRNKAFLLLGNLSFEEKNYKAAKSYYDSLTLGGLGQEETKGLQERKTALANIVKQLLIIERQDSLQRIAGMTPADRDLYIKKLVRMLRKQQGLRDEDEPDNGSGSSPAGNNNAPPDLFNNGAGSGDWYFYNSTLKSKGYADFKTRWGNRPNVDNWMLSSLVNQSRLSGGNNNQRGGLLPDNQTASSSGPATINYKTLMNGLPLTPEKLAKSQDTLAHAFLALGKVYEDALPDYPSAIAAYDSALAKSTNRTLVEETLLGLYYSYKKTGDEADAEKILQRMQQDFPHGKFTALAVNPDSVSRAADLERDRATRQYDGIYTDFIEGKFDEALAGKKQLDSLYGDKYWTPQLLYIESVYFIQGRQDPQAVTVLNSLKSKFPGTPMAEKAARLLDVLSRRRQIEAYLTNLKVTRAADTVDLSAMNTIKTTDTRRPLEPTGPRNVKPQERVLYPRDSMQNKTDSGRLHAKTDSGRLGAAAHPSLAAFTLDPDKQHAVVIVMNKVDPVFIRETKNAFDGYDQENYYSLQLTIDDRIVNDSLRLVVIDSFPTAAQALDYMTKARALAPRNIVPWLPEDKYSFLIISPANMAILLSNKDLAGYRRFLAAAFPGKF